MENYNQIKYDEEISSNTYQPQQQYNFQYQLDETIDTLPSQP